MEATLNLYVGNPEDDLVGNYLYLDLLIHGLGEFNITSSGRLDEEGSADIHDQFVKILNSASLAVRALDLPLCFNMEDIREMLIELDVDDSTVREIEDLLRNFVKETKGEL